MPLTLAWAITVHKSQGMSIDKLHVSLGDVFCEGQCYVALSRATGKAGLQIQGFQPSVVRVSMKALEFDKTGIYSGKTWLQEAADGWGELVENARNRAGCGRGGGNSGGQRGGGRSCMDCGTGFGANEPKWMIRCKRCYARNKNGGGGGRGVYGGSWRNSGGGKGRYH